ncbi:MAG: Gfo/Idh/MocA family oxidoreductase [Megasphaera sp.]|jgi:myo-inositol 2-dehydrogenase/D-chiro-inositol 1-dehydrogenase|nr:Gfo/Idh/MocA family oxidoreductase [Megasphaera sp.]MCH4188496.1 Gfo/Idh/MocA family oxidoreductase [Megasphaera sp.]MCH4218438.1 Gfo/Idh/MocA family oxidoreductase [Megasphaera sp.]
MKKIKVGIAGLGRLGKVHANNIAYKIAGADLVAACSIVPAELEYAQKELGVHDVYADYNDMLANADIDAVVIVTTSSQHCWQIAAALDAGKHVFTDKPLGVTLEECRLAEDAVKRHPDKTFFLGFMRRFDPSYVYAMEKIRAGAIGKPYMVKATGIDPEALVQGAIKFAPTSGGIFIDMAIHDIDLMRWFLGDDPVEVYAMGSTFKHPEFKAAHDDETGVAMYKCANGAIGFVHVGRTAPYGYHVETEVIGTEGTLRISPVPAKNLCMIYDNNGVVQECVSGFPERFADAYRLEMENFIDCAAKGIQPEVNVYDGTKSTQIAFATTESYRQGHAVSINY